MNCQIKNKLIFISVTQKMPKCGVAFYPLYKVGIYLYYTQCTLFLILHHCRVCVT